MAVAVAAGVGVAVDVVSGLGAEELGDSVGLGATWRLGVEVGRPPTITGVGVGVGAVIGAEIAVAAGIGVEGTAWPDGGDGESKLAGFAACGSVVSPEHAMATSNKVETTDISIFIS